MYCINYRVGILFRQNLAKKSYQLRYFFIDDQANLFHIPSLARLQKIIRLSSNFQQIRQKLLKFGEKYFSLHKYQLSQHIKTYHSEAVIPFSNRTYFQIKPLQSSSKITEEKQQQPTRSYQIFGLIDDDTQLLHWEIQVLTGKKKVEEKVKRKSIIEDEKFKQEQKLEEFFKKYLKNEEKFKMSNNSNIEVEQQSQQDKGQRNNHDLDQKQKSPVKKQPQPHPQMQFLGQLINGKAEGKGSQTLIYEGISYTGQFTHGQKHGKGLLVSADLDSLDCQYLNDELVGI